MTLHVLLQIHWGRIAFYASGILCGTLRALGDFWGDSTGAVGADEGPREQSELQRLEAQLQEIAGETKAKTEELDKVCAAAASLRPVPRHPCYPCFWPNQVARIEGDVWVCTPPSLLPSPSPPLSTALVPGSLRSGPSPANTVLPPRTRRCAYLHALQKRQTLMEQNSIERNIADNLAYRRKVCSSLPAGGWAGGRRGE